MSGPLGLCAHLQPGPQVVGAHALKVCSQHPQARTLLKEQRLSQRALAAAPERQQHPDPCLGSPPVGALRSSVASWCGGPVPVLRAELVAKTPPPAVRPVSVCVCSPTALAEPPCCPGCMALWQEGAVWCRRSHSAAPHPAHALHASAGDACCCAEILRCLSNRASMQAERRALYTHRAAEPSPAAAPAAIAPAVEHMFCLRRCRHPCCRARECVSSRELAAMLVQG